MRDEAPKLIQDNFDNDIPLAKRKAGILFQSTYIFISEE